MPPNSTFNVTGLVTPCMVSSPVSLPSLSSTLYLVPINFSCGYFSTSKKSADFFDAENHGQLKFVGNKYEVKGDSGQLHGELTIRGVSKPVTVKVEFGGIVTDPYGQTKAGFTVTGKINRKDFGLSWGGVTETGGVVLGDEVKINAEIQLIKKADVSVEEKELEEQA